MSGAGFSPDSLPSSSVRVSSPGSKDSKGKARADAAWRTFDGRKGVQTTRFLAGPPQRAPVDDTMCQTRASPSLVRPLLLSLPSPGLTGSNAILNRGPKEACLPVLAAFDKRETTLLIPVCPSIRLPICAPVPRRPLLVSLSLPFAAQGWTIGICGVPISHPESGLASQPFRDVADGHNARSSAEHLLFVLCC